jgi:hypothetical protein
MNNLNVNALAAGGSEIVAGTAGGAVISTNMGLSWSEADSGLTDANVLSIAIGGQNLFAGASYVTGVLNPVYHDDIFFSMNNGASWHSISDGLKDSSVISLIIMGANLFAATTSGIWKRALSEVVSVSPPQSVAPAEI